MSCCSFILLSFCPVVLLSLTLSLCPRVFLSDRKLEVQLPRFVLERSYSLKDVLQSFDVTQVFQDDADITNMGGAKAPPLTQVSSD